MPVYFEDVRQDLVEFKDWLDQTIPLGGGYSHERPIECLREDRVCDGRSYAGPLLLPAVVRLRGYPPGTKVTSDKFDLNLVLHEPGCDYISSVEMRRNSQSAHRDRRETIAFRVTDRELSVAHSSGNLIVRTMDKGGQKTGAYSPTRDINSRGTTFEQVMHPKDVGVVKMILNAMRTEITRSLAAAS